MASLHPTFILFKATQHRFQGWSKYGKRSIIESHGRGIGCSLSLQASLAAAAPTYYKTVYSNNCARCARASRSRRTPLNAYPLSMRGHNACHRSLDRSLIVPRYRFKIACALIVQLCYNTILLDIATVTTDHDCSAMVSSQNCDQAAC